MPGLILPKREIKGRFAALADSMQCDHTPAILMLTKCPTPPENAPRLIVPSKTQQAPGHEHVRIDFRDLHLCHVHTGELKIDTLLTDRLKREVELAARATRPIDWKPDFEAAHLVYVSIFTPEYQYFETVKHLLPKDRLQEAWGGAVI